MIFIPFPAKEFTDSEHPYETLAPRHQLTITGCMGICRRSNFCQAAA